MLNPESVDVIEGVIPTVNIVFSDDNAVEVIRIMLTKNEAQQLRKMLQEKLRYRKDK